MLTLTVTKIELSQVDHTTPNITRNEGKASYPVTYRDTICNASLLTDTLTMPGTTMLIRDVQHHVLASFLVMFVWICLQQGVIRAMITKC